MMEKKMNNIYETLFDDQKTKAEAFDKIAENFYFANFGSMSKTDFETLMFSIYIEKILEKSVNEPDTFSDYTLSKYLGITQQKINNLKIRKELKYPRKEFNWKKAFLASLSNAVLEKNKIKVFIDDPNIAIEVKHAIEINGGFTDSSFNPKICVISPADFIDLICILCEKSEVYEIKNKILDKLNKNTQSVEFLQDRPFGKQLKDKGIDFGIDLLGDLLSEIPLVGKSISKACTDLINLLRDKGNLQKFKFANNIN